MKLENAIRHERNLAAQHLSVCDDSAADYHQQVADWLEELASLRQVRPCSCPTDDNCSGPGCL